MTGAIHFEIPILNSPQLISLIWGKNCHIFKPSDVPFERDEYPLQVLIKQVSIFGPVPLSYGDFANDERLGILTAVINLISEHNLQRPFHLAVYKELSKEDKTFICKIMKLDHEARSKGLTHRQRASAGRMVSSRITRSYFLSLLECRNITASCDSGLLCKSVQYTPINGTRTPWKSFG